ncbi:MAG: nuclease-related domain-containing protein [Promethearchaeota archaeon]
MCAKAYLKKNGKRDTILEELHKLPSQFIILKNKFLRLPYKVTHHKTSESIKSCHIDYVVIGPTGIFIIEAKDWEDELFSLKIPHIETDRAGLIVYILLHKHFTKYIPIYNIVATPQQLPVIRYNRVRQLTVWRLTTFIHGQEDQLSKSDIRKIKKVFMKRL